jgi:polyphosphate kinase
LEYINRELSWLAFNARVLEQALPGDQPLLDSAKFLGITSSNLDEFFMVRVASLKHLDPQIVCCPSSMRASEVLAACGRAVREMLRRQYAYFLETLLPSLARAGVHLVPLRECSEADIQYLSSTFHREVLPVLTPRAVDPERPPLLASLRLYLAFLLRPARAPDDEPPKMAVLQIHRAVERIRRLPPRDGWVGLVLAESVVERFAGALFPGHTILDTACFRLTRDADLTVDEQRDEDYLEAMQEILRQRTMSPAVRMEIQDGKPVLRDRLERMLGLSSEDVYEIPGPLDLRDFMYLPLGAEYDHLRHPVWHPRRSPEVPDDESLWQHLRAEDVLLHHPYESFETVCRLLELAAVDPDVLAIKITLYRTNGDSRIVRALLKAAQQGKHVVAIVELKARFDEERNIEWAQALSDAGAVVIHGIAGLKVHAKATMIVRRETGGVVRYVHLSTGNYNDRTATLYTDLGYLTTRDEIARDLSLFFNAITGYSSTPALTHLVMAPSGLKGRLATLIRREAARSTPHNPGRIVAKMNSLVDEELIQHLYDASAAGVQVALNVRGICCLRPGVPGVSDNIRVVSVLDHFLEHSRICYFHNGGETEVYLSSADWMPRNLERRVELMFPVLDERLKDRAIDILMLPFRDTARAYTLRTDGTYTRIQPAGAEKPLRSQEQFLRQAHVAVEKAESTSRREMRVRKQESGS